jgi:hypothetical protein
VHASPERGQSYFLFATTGAVRGIDSAAEDCWWCCHRLVFRVGQAGFTRK